MLMNIGEEFKKSENRLVTTTAWRLNGKPTYAFEGSIFMGGATMQWLRDELKLISSAPESEEAALSVPDSGGAYLVPAFTGLGAPHWNMYARGTIVGMTRGTNSAQIVRAALESIAYQSKDLLDAMVADLGSLPESLKVDGGASANRFLMQFQSDIMNVKIIRPEVLETTALGAALLAGLAVGMYKSLDEIASVWEAQDEFNPKMKEEDRHLALKAWQRAVRAALYWAEDRE